MATHPNANTLNTIFHTAKLTLYTIPYPLHTQLNPTHEKLQHHPNTPMIPQKYPKTTPHTPHQHHPKPHHPPTKNSKKLTHAHTPPPPT